MAVRIALIRGDGVGPEVVEASLPVIEKLNRSYKLGLEFVDVEAGDGALRRRGDPLPQESLKEIEKADVVLKGPVGETAKDVIVRLRQMYDMYANVRPAFSIPGLASKFEGVDLVVVRENTEDLYKGVEQMVADDVAVALKIVSRKASERIVKFAADMARTRRRKVTCVHKANVMKVTDGLFASACRSLKGTDVQLEEMYVDAAAANLVRKPQAFDVIVTTNVYGDILSDEASQIAGSLGIAPSANLGERKSLFEPVHGAAFDIAGKGVANPTAFLLSVGMMLEHIGNLGNDHRFLKASISLREAILRVYSSGRKLTPDVGGSASLADMANEIAQFLV
ncbi:isocitrate/isopropylmalate dehydrogenase family protein [Sulfodiicoccus acidiphilus]|uniref:isocitrate/isopropylmalate dehydrogenase family protein n=1 Tax=Sulfodiicoccus acidiphilus TaxID=1670455 RepID=UPI000F827394|nr:isocitrate/isopropylmalate dehydrogenase family protein [Sulfodiicoccus acidiphilus]